MTDSHETAPITRGNALLLANRMGAEFASENRFVFALLSKELFSSYARFIERVPDRPDKAWKRMPNMAELFREAREGFEKASGGSDPYDLRGLHIHILTKAVEVFVKAVPQLDGLDPDTSRHLHASTMHAVVGELMESRARSVRSIAPRHNSIVGHALSDRKKARTHETYLANIPDADLVAAYAVVAATLVRKADEVESELYPREQMIADAGSLVKAARVLGDIQNEGVHDALVSAENAYDEVRMTAKLSPSAPSRSPSLAP